MLRTLKPPPKIKAQSEHSFNDDVKLEMYRLKKSMENYPEVVEKRLTRDTSTRTFASEEEDTRHHIAIKDYHSGGNEHANDSRLPLIGGSQNLNNTTPARLNNVMNREDFIYSDSPGQNASPGRRIGAGLRDIMGTGENGDRTNKRAAEQAAYAAALQEQISDKKRNPGGNKLGKNEEYRWQNDDDANEKPLPYHASPPPKPRNPFGDKSDEDKPNNVLGRGGRTFSKNHHHNHSLEIGDGSSPMASSFREHDRYDGAISSPTKSPSRARGSNDPNISQLRFGNDCEDTELSTYEQLKKQKNVEVNPFGPGGAVSRSPSHSPGKARNQLVKDLYGNGGAVIGFDPERSKSKDASKSWKPSVRQVTSRERASVKTQKSILEEQISEVRARKEKEKRDELEEEAREERRVRAELAVMGISDQKELAAKKAAARDSMVEMQRLQEEKISEVLARKGRLGKKELAATKSNTAHHMRDRAPPKAQSQLRGKHSPRESGKGYDPNSYIASDGKGAGLALAFPPTYEEAKKAEQNRPQTSEMGPALSCISQLTNAALAPMGSKFMLEDGTGMNRIPSEEQFDSYLVNWQREIKDPRAKAGGIPRMQPPELTAAHANDVDRISSLVNNDVNVHSSQNPSNAMEEEKELPLPVGSSRLIPTNPYDGNDGVAGLSLMAVLGQDGNMSVGVQGGNSGSLLSRTLDEEKRKHAEYMNNIGSNTAFLEVNLSGESKQAFMLAHAPTKRPEDEPESYQQKLNAIKQRIKNIGNANANSKEKRVYSNVLSNKDPWEKQLVPLYTQLSPQQQRDAIMQAPIFVRAHSSKPDPLAMNSASKPRSPRHESSLASEHNHSMDEPIVSRYNMEAELERQKAKTRVIDTRVPKSQAKDPATISPVVDRIDKEVMHKKMLMQIDQFAKVNGMDKEYGADKEDDKNELKSQNNGMSPENDEESYQAKIFAKFENIYTHGGIHGSAETLQSESFDGQDADAVGGVSFDEDDEEDALEYVSREIVADAQNVLLSSYGEYDDGDDAEDNEEEISYGGSADLVEGSESRVCDNANLYGTRQEPEYEEEQTPYEEECEEPNNQKLAQDQELEQELEQQSELDIVERGQGHYVSTHPLDSCEGELVDNADAMRDSQGCDSDHYTSNNFSDSGDNTLTLQQQDNVDSDGPYSAREAVEDGENNLDYGDTDYDHADDNGDAERVVPIDQIYDADSSMNSNNNEWQQDIQAPAGSQDGAVYYDEGGGGEGDEYEEDVVESGDYTSNFTPSSGLAAPDDYMPDDEDIEEEADGEYANNLVSAANASRVGTAVEVPEEEEDVDAPELMHNDPFDDYDNAPDVDDITQTSGGGSLSSVHYSEDFVSKPSSMDQLLPDQLGMENYADADDIDEDEEDDEPQFVGVITFKLISGTDIAPTSTLFEGKCDPYVVLSLGTQQVECQRVDNSVNPEWNERVLLSWDGFSMLHAQVNDYNAAPVEHGFLGEAYMDLEQLELKIDETKSLDVKLENAETGSLRIEITLRAG